MDYRGQDIAYRLQNISLVLAAIIAFIAGWSRQSLQLSTHIYFVLLLVIGLLTIPSWPFYNLHPIEFAPEAKAHLKKNL